MSVLLLVFLYVTEIPSIPSAVAFDAVFEQTQKLQLEGSDDAMLLSDIGRAVFIDRYVIVHERDEQPRVMVFDRQSGAFVQQLGRFGQGPGEYQVVTSILASDDFIFMLDGIKASILIFNKDLSFKTQFAISGWTKNQINTASNLATIVDRDLLLWFVRGGKAENILAAKVSPGGVLAGFVPPSEIKLPFTFVGGGVHYKQNHFFVVKPEQPLIEVYDAKKLVKTMDINFAKATWPIVTEDGLKESVRKGIESKAFDTYLSKHMSSLGIYSIGDFLIVDYAAFLCMVHEETKQTTPVNWKYPSSILANPAGQVVYADYEGGQPNPSLVFYTLKN